MTEEDLRGEFDVAFTAFEALLPMDEAQRRRAVMWLAGALGVDLVDFDQETAREAFNLARKRLHGEGGELP